MSKELKPFIKELTGPKHPLSAEKVNKLFRGEDGFVEIFDRVLKKTNGNLTPEVSKHISVANLFLESENTPDHVIREIEERKGRVNLLEL